MGMYFLGEWVVVGLRIGVLFVSFRLGGRMGGL